MMWKICFAVSAAVLLIAVAFAIGRGRKYHSGQLFTSFNAVFVGVFTAVFVGLIPIFAVKLLGESAYLIKLIIFDALQTIQVFTINVGADLILDNINGAATSLSGVYSTYMTFLFFVAPVLTFGFLVSLFKNALVPLHYRLHFWREVFIFSELNEKSLMFAKNLRQCHKKSLIVFTDVDRDEDNVASEYAESAKELHALIFQKDIVSADFSKHSKHSGISMFVIGNNESDNLITSVKLLNKYASRERTNLYVFSTGVEGELMMSNMTKSRVKVRRIDEVRSLIYRDLYDHCEQLFQTAVTLPDGSKAINAVIVGLGKYGTEMLKTLTWYGQMDGYSLTIHAFDTDELAEDKFAALCPELMSKQYNGVKIPGESQYTIRIHSGLHVETKTFADAIASIPDITFVFVCLGDDKTNIEQAVNLRMLCERNGSKPIIKTVMYSTSEKAVLQGITNYRGQPYGIDVIGDLAAFYSEEVLINNELETQALERHKNQGTEDTFLQYEYNYRSSIASALHLKARIACGIPGAQKHGEQLSKEERDIIGQLEHRRWNAYMRSEGYVYSGSPNKQSRNDLAKMHHNLVDYDTLTEGDKRKDIHMGTL